jgi:hypothetical protein
MTIPSFKQYLVEETREVFFTFGRMNPPTIGHGKLMNVMSTKAGKNPYRIYVSQSQDPKKNPLNYQQKVKHARKMYPKHARSIMMDKSVKTVFDAATSLYDEGFNRITMVVGADRITEFKTLLNKYNGVKGRHGFYNFEKINIVSAGDRDPDADGVEGMSASKQRENAKNNDFTTFAQGVPSTMSNKDAKRLFNDVRAGMGLKETTSFKNHIELEPVSETRERFIEGELFNEGDEVFIKSSQKTGYIHRLGTNYVIVALDEGRISRQWLDNVDLIEKGFGGSSIFHDLMPALDNMIDRLGGGKKRWKYAIQQYDRLSKENPKMNFNSRVWKAAQIADVDVRGLRDFLKKAQKEGTDKWYKDQPEWGTPEATKKAKKMTPGETVKEEVTQQQLNDLEKFADRLLNKFDIDIEFTRHFKDRMNDPRNKPAITVPEMQKLFKKIADNKGKRIKKYGNAEAVLKDIQSDLNLPVVVNWKNGEFEVVNKTIMRKKGFKTTSPVVQYEDAVADARARIDKEKEQDKVKFDRILDRARIARARRKNQQTKPKV